jgi:hypothetical protein
MPPDARFAEDAAGGALLGAGAGAGVVDAVLEPPEHAPIAAAAASSNAGRAKELWVIPLDVLEYGDCRTFHHERCLCP